MRKEHIFGDYDRPKCNIIIHEFSRNNNKKRPNFVRDSCCTGWSARIYMLQSNDQILSR